jgi:hypothetical protein
VWIRSVKNVQDRFLDLELLNKAIGDLINDHSGAGDVMIVAFCAKLHDLLSHEDQAPLQTLLMENTVKLIKNIKIDECVSSISSIVDTADLDQYVTDLADYLSSLPRNKGNMIGFVLNALWIRVHHCQSLKNVVGMVCTKFQRSCYSRMNKKCFSLSCLCSSSTP